MPDMTPTCLALKGCIKGSTTQNVQETVKYWREIKEILTKKYSNIIGNLGNCTPFFKHEAQNPNKWRKCLGFI